MIFLLIDFFLSFFSSTPTYFLLISILLYPKNKIFLFLLIPLTLDLIILNTYFLNTIIFTIMFLIIKHLKVTKINLINYLILLTFLYLFYLLSIGLINNYSLNYLFKFILNNYIYNLIFYLLCYKILKPYIKLSR